MYASAADRVCEGYSSEVLRSLMTFYADDQADISYVSATGFWVLILNGIGVKDARREKTLRSFVEKHSVPWSRPTTS